MEPIIPTWKADAEALYAALKVSPCRCEREWHKAVYAVVKVCSRCNAIEFHETVRELLP